MSQSTFIVLAFMVIICMIPSSMMSVSAGIGDECPSYSSCGSCASIWCDWCVKDTYDGACVYKDNAPGHVGCDRTVGFMESAQCPPPSWSPYLMVVIVPVWLLFTWCYIGQCNEKVESKPGDTCHDCKHVLHHQGHTCEVAIPNKHVTCQCGAACAADDLSLRPTELAHCGRTCGRRLKNVHGGGTCACTQCTCSRCAPQIICGCNACQCHGCMNREYEMNRDKHFCWVRVPMSPVGFAIMIWSAVMHWTFGIIWGVLMWLVIPCVVRRSPGRCGRPKKRDENDVPHTGDTWQLWNDRETKAQRAFPTPSAPSIPSTSPNGLSQNGMYIPPSPIIPPPPRNPYEHGVVGSPVDASVPLQHQQNMQNMQRLPAAVPVMDTIRTPLLSSVDDAGINTASLIGQKMGSVVGDGYDKYGSPMQLLGGTTALRTNVHLSHNYNNNNLNNGLPPSMPVMPSIHQSSVAQQQQRPQQQCIKCGVIRRDIGAVFCSNCATPWPR